MVGFSFLDAFKMRVHQYGLEAIMRRYEMHLFGEVDHQKVDSCLPVVLVEECRTREAHSDSRVWNALEEWGAKEGFVPAL